MTKSKGPTKADLIAEARKAGVSGINNRMTKAAIQQRIKSNATAQARSSAMAQQMAATNEASRATRAQEWAARERVGAVRSGASVNDVYRGGPSATAIRPAAVPPSAPRATSPAPRQSMTGRASGAMLPAMAVIQAGGAYNASREAGNSRGRAALDAAATAAPTAALAATPALASQRFASAAQATTRVGGKLLAAAGSVAAIPGAQPALLPGAIVGGTGLAMQGLNLAARAVGRLAMPAALAYGGVTGAMKDQNRVRGAARGALEMLDPTELFMGRGVLERGFDALFGRAKPPAAKNAEARQAVNANAASFAAAKQPRRPQQKKQAATEQKPTGMVAAHAKRVNGKTVRVDERRQTASEKRAKAKGRT